MKNKEKITMGTILFIDSQYIVTAKWQPERIASSK